MGIEEFYYLRVMEFGDFRNWGFEDSGIWELLNFGILAFGNPKFGDLGKTVFWGTLGFGDSSILWFWNLVILVFWVLGFGDRRVLLFEDSGLQGFWISGTWGFWDSGTLGFWNLGKL